MNELDQKIALYRKLQSELGAMAMPDLHIGIRVTDKDGKLLEDRYEQGHSWTRNGWNIFNAWMMDSPSNVTATSGASPSYQKGYLGVRDQNGSFTGGLTGLLLYRAGGYYGSDYAGYGFQNNGSLNTFGIQVGTSDEPFHGEDFRLFGLVASGTASGQLSHIAQPVVTPVYDSGAKTYTQTYSRVFNNNSSGAIVIKEVGMSTGGYLVSRDVLASPVNVPVGAQLTIYVAITTAAFTTLESSMPARPDLGASYGGGFFFGFFNDWVSSPTLGVIGAHTKYALIVAPATGGEAAAKKMSVANADITIADYLYGAPLRSVLTALCADSEVGVFTDAANAAVLGGHSDWYVPGNNETSHMYTNRGLLTGGDVFQNADYWASQQWVSNGTYKRNLSTNATGVTYNNSALYVRLVRRHTIT